MDCFFSVGEIYRPLINGKRQDAIWHKGTIIGSPEIFTIESTDGKTRFELHDVDIEINEDIMTLDGYFWASGSGNNEIRYGIISLDIFMKKPFWDNIKFNNQEDITHYRLINPDNTYADFEDPVKLARAIEWWLSRDIENGVKVVRWYFEKPLQLWKCYDGKMELVKLKKEMFKMPIPAQLSWFIEE